MSQNQRILNYDEIERLQKGAKQGATKTAWSQVEPETDLWMIKTCLWHGLRNEETVTLQRKHIDLNESDGIGINIERKNTKSDHGVRFVPTLSQMKTQFVEFVENRTENPDDFLFPSTSNDSHLSTQYFRDLMFDLAWKQGLYPTLSDQDMVRNTLDEAERVRPHALRHTYGTKMYENDVPPKELSDIMGHKSIETTMDLYAHLATERSRTMLDEAAQSW